MQRPSTKRPNPGRIIAVLIWVTVILLVFIHRDKLTLDSILRFTPENTLAAVLIMLFLYIVKGCTMAINGYLLNAAGGIMFSLPLALTVNAAGSILMLSLPYLIGRKEGQQALTSLTERYKRLEGLRKKPNQNGLLVSVTLRLLGVLPCEVVSMYLGACGLSFPTYIIGSLLGVLPGVLAFTLVGEYATEPGSIQFAVAVGICLLGTAAAILLGIQEKRKER